MPSVSKIENRITTATVPFFRESTTWLKCLLLLPSYSLTATYYGLITHFFDLGNPIWIESIACPSLCRMKRITHIDGSMISLCCPRRNARNNANTVRGWFEAEKCVDATEIEVIRLLIICASTRGPLRRLVLANQAQSDLPYYCGLFISLLRHDEWSGEALTYFSRYLN